MKKAKAAMKLTTIATKLRMTAAEMEAVAALDGDMDYPYEFVKRRRRWFAQFPFGVSPSSLLPVRRRVQRGSGGSLGRCH
jgi:hypothetical protein